MKKNKNIEQLFRKEFESFEVQPSPKVWKGIRSDLLIKNFFHFSPWSLNAWYIGGILTITSLAFYLAQPSSERIIADKSPVSKVQVKTADENFNPRVSAINDQAEISIEKSSSLLTKSKVVKQITANEIPTASAKLINENVNNNEALSPPDNKNNAIYTGKTIMAWFDCTLREGCAPFTTGFRNLSQNAVRYSWSFGDGGSSELENPDYIFDESGTWFVSLTAWSANNEISIFTDSIQVNPLPVARFSMDIQNGQDDEQTVYFYNYSRGADNYLWDFGDGSTSQIKEPDHFFSRKSGGDIKLVAISEEGCRDSTILTDAFKEGEPEFFFPTAFSPNPTGPQSGYYTQKTTDNNIFHPYVKEIPEEYQLKVFNRSGILIFESNDINVGWTGYYHEELLPQGVYVWKGRAKFSDGRSVVKMGDVTLLWGE